jgi:hypothetical protein
VKIGGSTTNTNTNSNTNTATNTKQTQTQTQPKEDPSRPIADGNYTIYSAIGKNMVLDIYGPNARNIKNGTNVQIWQKQNTDTQTFNVTYNTSKKLYVIKNTYQNFAVDVYNGRKTNGTNVQMYKVDGTNAQYFKITKNGDGTYTIGSACSDKVLDVNGGVAKNGTNVQVWAKNNGVAQKWNFKRA